MKSKPGPKKKVPAAKGETVAKKKLKSAAAQVRL
jgi:hypothetical protein